mmetsp:Transcript_32166/g.41247  ORF Transcript_32166/g.41247 Transcript_32166/m.41247 type:complete len:85 (-) Transcript_32166:30-284(-)
MSEVVHKDLWEKAKFKEKLWQRNCSLKRNEEHEQWKKQFKKPGISLRRERLQIIDTRNCISCLCLQKSSSFLCACVIMYNVLEV